MTKWIAAVLVLLTPLGSWLIDDAASAGETSTGQVLEHHGNPSRSGLYIVPSLTWEAARGLHRDPGFRAEVAGPVYAQPLYWAPPGGGTPLLIVATEQNLVYALDATTGALAWKTSLGAPAPRSALPCGNIDPMGVTGTPVIDEQTQAVYLDAMMLKARGAPPRHEVFALSLKDGSVRPGWPVDVEAALAAKGETFASAEQGQRGALAIVGDRLYVPYGGHFGDCGAYHGRVVGISLAAPTRVLSWSTAARGGGIWAPGGVVSDGHALYVTTGNTMGAKAWGGGEAVIRLGLDLTFSGRPQDYFAPANWRDLDDGDLDLGGTNPLLVTLPGAAPAELALALGKDGNAYLLDRQALGGIGGGLRAKRVSQGPIRTSPATFAGDDGVYVAFQGRGVDCPAGEGGDLTVLKISAGAPPDLRVAWCAAAGGRGSPIVTTTDGRSNPIVWTADAEGDNRLRGYRGDTGEVVFAGGATAESMGPVRRFQTVIAAARRFYVAGDKEIYAFAF